MNADIFVTDNEIIASKRKFLQQIACASLLAVGGTDIASAKVRHVYYSHAQKNAAVATKTKHFDLHRTIALNNPNTGDSLSVTYFEQGRYVHDALAEINYLVRDYHTGDIHPIDPSLLDLLHNLKQTLDINKPFNVISGYRSPYTNASLRNQSHGVAKNSLHMQGKAIDIRVDGLATKDIRNAALALRQGGVGYYPANNFVHIDTGEFRTW